MPEDPPPWAGAPGYHPEFDEERPPAPPRPGYVDGSRLSPHAPLPGAPPYPAPEPVAPRNARPGFWRRLFRRDDGR